MNPTARPPRHVGGDRDDRGAVLPMVLVLLVIGSMIIAGLLRYTATVTRTQPVLAERPVASESATSAMRQAILLQISEGPGACVESSQYASGAFGLNGYSASVSCTTQSLATTGNGRYAVIATQQDPKTSGLRGLDAATGPLQVFDVDGDVFLDGGDLAHEDNARILVRGTSLDPHVIRYTDSVETAPGVTSPEVPEPARYRIAPPPDGTVLDPLTGLPVVEDVADGVVGCDVAVLVDADTYRQGPSQIDGVSSDHDHPPCLGGAPWWEYAGADPNPLDGSEDRLYPLLPQLPTYLRDGRFVDIGSCRIYYPGRYTDDLKLDASRQHYFASGLYSFTADLRVEQGARAVMGEGRTAGCAVDADAALAQTAPLNHEITGKGATVLLGHDAKIEVKDGSLSINRRVSSPSTRGSEGVAIRTVNAGTSTKDVQVPRDRVQEGEYPCVEASPGVCVEPFTADQTDRSGAVDLAAHEIVVSTSPLQTAAYEPSKLDVDDVAVLLEVKDPTSAASTGLVVDGNVFVPGSRFVVDTTGASTADERKFHLRVRAGVVASSVEIRADRLPEDPASNWYLGVSSEPVQRRVELVASASGTGGTSVSRAVVEVHESGSYAINSWSVDAPS